MSCSIIDSNGDVRELFSNRLIKGSEAELVKAVAIQRGVTVVKDKRPKMDITEVMGNFLSGDSSGK